MSRFFIYLLIYVTSFLLSTLSASAKNNALNALQLNIPHIHYPSLLAKEESEAYGYNQPTDIAISDKHNLAYVVNNSANSLLACPLDNKGDFFSCNVAGPGAMAYKTPVSIVLNPTKPLLYITDRTHDAVSTCQLDSSGMVKTCKDDTDPKFDMTFGLALSPDNVLYVSNISKDRPPSISKCVLDASGNPGPCSDALVNAPLGSPAGLTLSNDGKIMFIADLMKGKVFRCDVDSTKNLTNCSDTGGTGFTNPIRVKLSKKGDFAIVASFGKNVVMRCSVSADGHFSNCTDSQASSAKMKALYGLELNKDDTIGYLSDINDNTVYRCDMDSNGNFSGCRYSLFPFTISQNGINAQLFAINAQPGGENDVTIKNTSGVNLNGLKFDIDDQYKSIITDKSTCPLGVNGKLAVGATCTLHYAVPLAQVQGTFNIKISNNGALLYSLPFSISKITMKQNGKSSGAAIMFQGDKNGQITLNSGSDINDLSMVFSGNSALQNVFTGNCLSVTSLQKGGSCTLNYNLPIDAPPGSYFFLLKSKGVIVYSLNLTIKNGNALGVTGDRLKFYMYNEKIIPFTNLSNRDLKNVKIWSTNNDVLKILDVRCCSGNACPTADVSPGLACTVQFYLKDNRFLSTPIKIGFSADNMSTLFFPVAKSSFLQKEIVVSNRGAYALTYSNPMLDKTGHVVIQGHGSFPVDMDSSADAVIFNRPDLLPQGLFPITRLNFHFVGGKSPKLDSNGHNVTCNGTTLTGHCFYNN